MGGTKPRYHFQLEPAATDHKNRPDDEGILEREKHELASNAEQGDSLIPKRGKKSKPAARKPAKPAKKRR